MSTEDQRQRWKAHWQAFHALSSAWQESGYAGPAPTYPELPDDLVGMTCGAVTRAGTPCKQKAIYSNGRCKFHGGLATGPTTEAGKEQCRVNGRKGGRPRKADSVLNDVNVSEAIETEVMETDKTRVSEALHGAVLGRMAGPEMSTDAHILAALEQQVIVSNKPKSWDSRKVMVLGMCERCTMFTSNGACLAVAKGRISSMPTDGSCAGFSAF